MAVFRQPSQAGGTDLGPGAMLQTTPSSGPCCALPLPLPRWSAVEVCLGREAETDAWAMIHDTRDRCQGDDT